MKKLNLFFAAAAVVTLIACKKGEEPGVRINPQDIGFVHLSTLSNAAEIALGQLAADSSQTPAIQAYGQKMVSEHGMALSDLETLAANLGIPTPDTLTRRHVDLINQLKTLKGRSFDSLYIVNQVADHQNAINLHENAHSIGNNSQLKDYARGLLPHLFNHLQEAQNLAAGY